MGDEQRSNLTSAAVVVSATSEKANHHANVDVRISEDMAELAEQPLKSIKASQGQQRLKASNRSTYQVSGCMQFRMESSHLCKLAFFGFAILLGFGFLVCIRLNTLENRISSLQLELQAVKQFNQLSAAGLVSYESLGSEEAVVPGLPLASSEETSEELSLELASEFKLVHTRSRRSLLPPSPVTPTNVSNVTMAGTNASLELDSVEGIDSNFTTSNSSRVSRHLKQGASVGRRGRDRERGKVLKPAKLLQRLDKANLRRIAEKEKRLKLRDKLEAARNHASKLNKIISQRKEIRAAYLRPAGAHVSIESSEQYIGPWHLASDAKAIGFNALWYDNLALDDNGTSVIFIEGGLYSISSQVYYHSSMQKERTMPMGYKIFVKKSLPTKFQRPFPVAECVTAYPSTYFQTCFTAVTWYLDKGDEVFLKHFKNSFPIIEADEQGKTFLQIVRLGG